MNGLDLLRWVLLLVGAVILIGVYFAGRRSLGARWRRRRAKRERVELPEVDSGASSESLTVPDPELAELAELGRGMAIDEPHAHHPHHAAPKRAEPVKAERPRPKAAASPARPEPKLEPKIVVVYIVAPAGTRFRGTDVFNAAREAGLEYGEMRIFHRYEAAEGERQSVFSLASMVEPGWFAEDEQEQIQTPGLALFLQLPGPLDGVKAFDAMIEAGNALKRSLGGELRDASRSVMSQQTIAHVRDEVGEYERRRHARSGSAH